MLGGNGNGTSLFSGSIHEKPANRKSALSVVPFPKLYFIILSLLMKDLTFTHFFVPNCKLGMLVVMKAKK